MSDTKRQTPEEIQEMKIPKMEETNTIIGNPGFPGINQSILFCLDHKSQMAFRQVCQSWKEEVDQPLFWIKKLSLKSYPKGLVMRGLALLEEFKRDLILKKK